MKSAVALAMLASAAPCQAQDGISSLWKMLYPDHLGTADSDGDGVSDYHEAIAGTDPLDPLDHLRSPRVKLNQKRQTAYFEWEGVVGKRYSLDRLNPSTEIWEEVAGKTAKQTGTQILPIWPAPSSALFRLRVSDQDTDGDGMNAWEEAMLGMKDDSPASSGRPDVSTAYRMIEGEGFLTLANGREIPKQPLDRSSAVRFLAQASFGADPEMIDHLMSVGTGAWLDAQLNPATVTMTTDAMQNNGPLDISIAPYQWSRGWWRGVMTGQDQLRQRMGYALSQILVISAAGNDSIRGNPPMQSVYYDRLLQHSLGNYRDLLDDVTYSTQMGFYLSHLQNRKADPSIGRFPDENFAREVMQLFTIGLWELNQDGTRKLDASGNFIPTYDNATIMEMAKVFTGFGFGGPTGHTFLYWAAVSEHHHLMKMYDDEHEPGEKHIIGNVVLPAGQSGEKDVDDALDALCDHPNIGPFISRLLIQRFTSSNPSAGYIRRISGLWADNGEGIRGDLKTVIEGILMDPEARIPEALGDHSGKVREPYLRLVALMRAFKARNSQQPPTFPIPTLHFPAILGQQPMFAPSVFNFYSPNHSPAGELRDAGLTSPELEIATSNRMLEMDNLLARVIAGGMDPFYSAPEDIVRCDFTTARSLAADAQALVDHLDELLTWGCLSPSTRAAVITAVEAHETPEKRVEVAVHLIVESPDFVVLK